MNTNYAWEQCSIGIRLWLTLSNNHYVLWIVQFRRGTGKYTIEKMSSRNDIKNGFLNEDSFLVPAPVYFDDLIKAIIACQKDYGDVTELMAFDKVFDKR